MTAEPLTYLHQLHQELPYIAQQARASEFHDQGVATQNGDGRLPTRGNISADVCAELCSVRNDDDDPIIGCLYRSGLGTMSLEWVVEGDLSLDYTHVLKTIESAPAELLATLNALSPDDVVCSASICRLFTMYSGWRSSQLRQLAGIHDISSSRRDNRNTLYQQLLAHNCTDGCLPSVVVFTTLSRVRTEEQVTRSRAAAQMANTQVSTESSYLKTVDDSLKQSIIREWQDTICTANLEQGVCAPCGRRYTRKSLSTIHPDQFDLTLLRNDALHPRTHPRSYAFALYDRALLDPEGMFDRWTRADLRMCRDCKRELVEKGRTPRLCLANWLYYGHDVLPPQVATAIAQSSPFDRMLVARARSSRISFRFTERRRRAAGDRVFSDRQGTSVTSQRFVKGNVLVMPQNTTHLNAVIPPPASVIRDTVCAVFVGSKKPTKDTIGGLGPVLVRRSNVEIISRFLVEFNPFYAPDDNFFGFSEDNLDALFDGDDARRDVGVPCAMDIGFIEDSDCIRASTSDYTGRADGDDELPDGEDVLMENVGYTSGNRSPVSYRDMKLRALSHCLNGGRFIRSQAGDSFVPDFHNPSLLTWLFPHLDPWGIGGFHHPDRSQPITMEEQLRYLLQRADGRFQKDADFAFVYFNILQKKAVCDSVHFRVKETEQRRTVERLLAVDRDLLQHMIAKYDKKPDYVPETAEESELLSLVNSVGAVLHDIPGTSGYKLNMRNQIRGLVTFHGTPAFFITLNPSDIHHPLVRLFAGHEISLEDAAVGDELTEWRRRLLVASNPGASAMFFHTMISNFVDIVLRFGRREPGIFGMCTAYYGTVEAQARGTLHCHMLVWVKDHPSPQAMRDMMVTDDDYRERMFAWLESLIKCEPLGRTEPIHASSPSLGRRSRHTAQSEYTHPGVCRPPRIDTLLPADFKRQYVEMVNDLVNHFNWHEHMETCWKYLRKNEPRVDANCRMRMDGAVRPITTLDSDTLSIQLRRLHPWIASYNDLVIFLLQANMDLKHIGSGEGAKALIFYITDYITKASIPAHLGLAALMYAIQRTDEKYKGVTQWGRREDEGALTILVNSMVSRMEISHPQVMSYLIGGGDHYTSHRYRLLHYASFSRLVGRHWDSDQETSEPTHVGDDLQHASLTTTPPSDHGLLPSNGSVASDENVVVGGDDDNDGRAVTLLLAPGSISAMNQQQDYLLRPAEAPFDTMALYQFTGMTEKITTSAETRRLQNRPLPATDGPATRGRPLQNRGWFLPAHPQHSTHLVRMRTTWVVPVILGDRLPRRDRTPEERELWARAVLTLFVPWRAPADLKQADETWSAAYERLASTIPTEHQTIIHNIGVLSECKDARDKALISVRNRAPLAGLPTTTIGSQLFSVEPQDAVRPYREDVAGADDPQDATFEPLHHVEINRRSVAQGIDDIISTPARVALDNCFREDAVPGSTASFGTASPVDEDDIERLTSQQTTMRKLKRKRRPSPVRPGPSSAHTWYRTGGSRQPVVDISTIAASTSTQTWRAAGVPRAMQTNVDLLGVIQQVVIEYGLQHNQEQLRAFEIVAHHACFGGPQLLMYIAGVGGTGKSYVVKSILRLFTLLGRRDEVMVSAPTGAAAILIGGYTVHSLLMLPDREGVDLQPLVVLWAGVLYLIIDEVSMISALFLAEVSARLQHAKGTFALAEDVPFGGVNIVFFGDFGQLKPVGGASLYSHRVTKPRGVTTQDTQKVAGVEALKGAYLWTLVKKVVILRRNQHQSADAPYAALLARIRQGHSGAAREAGTANDYCTLQSRLIQNFDRDTAAQFRDAPIIVGVKSVRDPLNDLIVRHRAKALGAIVHRYHSRDRIADISIDSRMREVLWDLPSTTTRDALGRLPLFPGMKVMVQENIAFACNVVNGAVGTVRDIKYDEEDGIRYVAVVYVEIPGAGRYFGPDHSDVIPVFPVPTYFKLTVAPKTATTRAQELSITRMQPPLLPAYVFTDYKAQGRSLDSAIVDLDSALSLQGVYVMLSRVRTLEGLAVLRSFRPQKVEERISEDLRDEFARLEQLDRSTRAWYHRELCGMVV